MYIKNTNFLRRATNMQQVHCLLFKKLKNLLKIYPGLMTTDTKGIPLEENIPVKECEQK